ncbi:MAG: general secretion pathway protein GspD [Rhodocyclaceae bacterium]|nr:MAG: general secretion pathway protein GspD [Rhodocyclaceae bacterium]
MIRRSLRAGQAASLVAAIALTACAGAPTTKPGVVRDSIQEEMKQALAAKPAAPTPPANLDLSLLPPLQTDAPRQSKATDGRFDLNVQNAPAAQVFQGIVSGTQYSMLVSPDVVGNISVTLRNVTVREALDALRELYGYEYRVQGNRISIQSNTLQTRVFQLNYLAGRRQGTTDTRLTSTSLAGTGSNGTGTGTTGAVGGTGTTGTPGTGAGTAATGGAGGARISTTIDADFWKDVNTALTAVVGTADGRSVVLNPASGVVVVRGYPLDMRNVEAYLKATQLAVERQVMLEAKIIEVELNDDYQSGINWAAFRGSGTTRATFGSAGASTVLQPSGGTVATGTSALSSIAGTIIDANGSAIATGVAGAMAASATGGLLGLAFQTPSFAALLNFLQTQGTLHVLSSPRIATLNNQKALLKVGSDDFFVTNISTTTTTGTGATTTSPTVTLTPFFSGISLDVMPQIDEGSDVILHVHPTVSSVTEKTKTINLGTSGGSLVLPLASSTVNESDSIVRVSDGYIAAIGGLMSQQQTSSNNGLPGTLDSVASGLAGQKTAAYKKRELVILLKPTIIRDQSDWQSDLSATQGRLDAMRQ